MTVYTDTFGGANIYPSEISYSAVTLDSDVVLSWPEETSASDNLATRIIDVAPTASGFSITMPDARQSGTGNTVLFNNKGSYTFTVKNAAGTVIASLLAGTLWQIYLTSNTTEAGAWSTLQYGSTTSLATAASLAGTGITAAGSLLSQSVPVSDFNTDYTAGNSDRAKMYNWSGASGTLTLPDPVTVGNNWFIYLRNSGSGSITADAPGLSEINGSSTVVFNPGDSAIIASDGTGFYTVGFGQSATYTFSYTVLNIAGGVDYTLSGAELNQVAYRFTGAITADINVIVPDTVQQYWVDNQTTGSFIVTVKTVAGTGVTTVQNQRVILYCDGTDVLNAESASSLSLPVSVSQGGTGATSASSARINLGGTATGVAIYTAANAAAVWSTLGAAPVGTVDGGSF